MSEWIEDATDEPRFALDQWRRAEPGHLAQLERWSESEDMCRVFVFVTDAKGVPHFNYFQTKRLAEADALAWAEERRIEFTRKVTP